MKHFFENYFKTIKHFLPGDQTSSAIGLDVGSGECKLVELVEAGQEYELVSWSIEPIKNGDVKSAVEKMLKQLVSPCKSLYTSVFGKGTLIRYIDIPQMSQEDLRNSFDIESDKYFPFARDQIYTDVHILDVNAKEKKMLVLAAAARKELVDRRMKLLIELGLPVEYIGLNPIALANALSVLEFEKHEGKAKEVVAFLDMGDSVSNLTILVNGIPRFTRDIFIGGRDFTKSISNALGINFAEAEQLKSEPGESLDKIFGASENVIMNILQELRLSIDYFMTEKNHEVGRLLLTGGASMLEGIDESFEKSLEIKVDRWNAIERLKVAPGVSVENLEKISVKLGVALGLALYPLCSK